MKKHLVKYCMDCNYEFPLPSWIYVDEHVICMKCSRSKQTNN